MVAPDVHPILLFDGVCHLCRKSVQFVLKHDDLRVFRFVSQQSALGQGLLKAHGVTAPDALASVYLVDAEGIHTKSTAVLRTLKQLKAPWPCLYALIFIPASLRDFAYDFVGRRRYAWFGKMDACWLPDSDLKDRFPD